MNDSKELKKGFFKKLYYSIFKVEKYGELSAEGVGKALGYTLKLSLIVAIIISIGIIIKINQIKAKSIDFLNEYVGEFTYSNGVIKLDNNEPFRLPSKTFNEVIVDTRGISEEEIDNYFKSIEGKMGILVLRDKVLVKGLLGDGTVTYTYEKALKDLNITELDKTKAIEFLNGPEMFKILGAVFGMIALFVTAIIVVPIVLNAILLSLFGYMVSVIARARMRFTAVFNISIYALTLSVLLNAIYIVIKMLTGYTMTYFPVMYISISVIYVIAAILILKSEFIKIQQEVSKIVKISKQDDGEEAPEKNKDEKEQQEDGNKKQSEKQEEKDEQKGLEEGQKGE